MNMRNISLNTAAAVLLAVICWTAAIILVSGCGKKGPPVPPTGDMPPKVMDLDYRISNNILELSWTVPQTSSEAKSPVTGFLVFGSKQTTIEADCPNCPIFFREIGDIPVRTMDREQGKSSRMAFTQTIEPGFRYIYKVRAYDDDGIAGKDSNFVDFTF